MTQKPIIKVGDIEIQFCLDAADTNGQSTVFECRIGPGARVPIQHYHNAFDETVYCLEGTGTFTIGGETIELNPGEARFIPRGITHGFVNKTDKLFRFLAIASPGVFGPAYFEEIGAVLATGGPPDMAKIAAVMTAHGLVPVKP